MPHGGARSGAGRKRGSTTKRTREVAEKAILSGKTPLEVMLMAMRSALRKKKLAEAHSFAKDAAPYMHPRLSPIEPIGGADKPADDSARKLREQMAAIDKATEGKE